MATHRKPLAPELRLALADASAHYRHVTACAAAARPGLPCRRGRCWWLMRQATSGGFCVKDAIEAGVTRLDPSAEGYRTVQCASCARWAVTDYRTGRLIQRVAADLGKRLAGIR